MDRDDRPRVDLERMRKAYVHQRRAFSEGPTEDRKVTLRVKASIDSNYHMVGRAGRFRLESDEAPEHGGDGAAPSPLHVFLSGAAF